MFFDFTGCCALTCTNCNCGFCSWCLLDCGGDAHRHVANCPYNLAPGKNVFANDQLIAEGRKKRQERELKSYFGRLGNDMKGKVIDAMGKVLDGLKY